MTPHSDRPARGRPRQARVDDLISRATLELIRDSGPASVNVAAVAARTGLARTTIYRRYRNRHELLESAMLSVTQQGRPEGHLELHEKLEWVLARCADVLDGGIGRGGTATVLTDSDPEFSAALRRALEEGLAPVREQVTADAAQGILLGDLDPELVVDLVLGAHLAQVLRHGEASPQWRARTARALAALLGGRPA